MGTLRRRFAIVGSVWIGSSLLFAPPTFLATIWIAERALEAASASPSAAGAVLLNLFAVAVAVQTATEIAAWRLHGGDWLRRGGRRLRIVRLALATSVCIGVLVLIGLLTAAIAAAVVLPGGTASVAAAVVALTFGLAFVLSAVRTARAFYGGYRG